MSNVQSPTKKQGLGARQEPGGKPETRSQKLPFVRLRAGQPQAGLTFRLMHHGEEHTVCEMVHRVFDDSVAPLYSKRGNRSFKKYCDPEEMSHRVNTDHFVLLSLADGYIAGMIEMRRHRHISLLFVDPEFQGKGIGGELLRKAVELCRLTDPHLRELTVNSSPNALGAYERMGFTSTGGEQVISGVRFIPMKKVLGEDTGEKGKIRSKVLRDN